MRRKIDTHTHTHTHTHIHVDKSQHQCGKELPHTHRHTHTRTQMSITVDTLLCAVFRCQGFAYVTSNETILSYKYHIQYADTDTHTDTVCLASGAHHLTIICMHTHTHTRTHTHILTHTSSCPTLTPRLNVTRVSWMCDS